jgi:hypothetical protein
MALLAGTVQAVARPVRQIVPRWLRAALSAAVIACVWAHIHSAASIQACRLLLQLPLWG